MCCAVDKQELEIPLQDLIDRPPVDTRALHRHARAPGGREPVGEPQQLARGRPEGDRTAPEA
jgi:hypothetical protein